MVYLRLLLFSLVTRRVLRVSCSLIVNDFLVIQLEICMKMSVYF